MTYAPRIADAQAPLEKLYARLANFGFAHVLRDHNDKKDKKDIPGMFLFNEMWRLDKPEVRAYIGLDLDARGQMMVRFIHEPQSLTLAQRLKNVFGAQAGEQISSSYLSAKDILSAGVILPYCDDVSSRHAELAIQLNDHRQPSFFIRPQQSDDKVLALQGMIEPVLRPGHLGGMVKGPEDAPDFINRLGKAAAEQLKNIDHVSLRVACDDDVLALHAFKKLPCKGASKAESMPISKFIFHYDYYIYKHVEACRAVTSAPGRELTR